MYLSLHVSELEEINLTVLSDFLAISGESPLSAPCLPLGNLDPRFDKKFVAP